MTPRYIERSFPIAELNPLSQRERNAFKPIYKMHKWFARRSASTFRAILLGSALPYEGDDGAPLDLMAEFYASHQDDPRLRRPDGRPLRVLDPFMGGGTTVVEALRLGLDVTGIDYNPVAWFIVKGMTTPIDLEALEAAYERVAGKVRDKLLGLYKTRCPVTGDPDGADIIYGFWVKQGVCVDPACGASTDLFRDYEVARKRGDCTLAYVEVGCPACGLEFDWEHNRCTITAGGPQIAGDKASGKGRPADRPYVWSGEEGAGCPRCGAEIGLAHAHGKPKSKKVALHVLIDPSTGDLFEVRGEIPDEVTAPRSGHTFRPKDGTTARGKFTCAACGRTQSIVDSAQNRGAPLPFRYYAYYAYTPVDGKQAADRAALREIGLPTNNNKWFAAVTPADLARVEGAKAELADRWDDLPLPTQEIPQGRNFRDLRVHLYRRWCDLFGERQLLALGLLLKTIGEEPDRDLRDALLGAFQSCLDFNSRLARFNLKACKTEGTTSAHDFRNPTTVVESNVWGLKHGTGAFASYVEVARSAALYLESPDLPDASGFLKVADRPRTQWSPALQNTRADSRLASRMRGRPDLIITDPPYAGSVQYAEMSDYFYVWLHQVLRHDYPEFAPAITLKADEIIEDTMTKDADWYFAKLTDAWRACHAALADEGLLVFTFHHKEGDRWSGLLRSLFDAGFYLVAAYPTHSEALNSIVIQATKGITYDIIHVCRKRQAEPEPIPWAVLRRRVRQEAAARLRELEAGGDVLPGPDVWMILLGTALRLFSQHYGKVIDADGEPIGSIEEALERLSVVVREVRGEVVPLPAALQEVDGLSQVWLMHVLGKGGFERDGLHIELRGYAHSIDDLEDAGLVASEPGRAGRLAPVSLLARFAARRGALRPQRDASLVDKLTLLLGTDDEGGDVRPLFEGWRGHWEALRAALERLGREDAGVREASGRLARALEGMGPEGLPGKGQQLRMDLT